MGKLGVANQSTTSEGKHDRRPYAEQGNEQGLQRMNDEDEQSTCRLLYAIEDKDRLHGKVPGAGSVGRRHQDSKGTHDKGNESCQRTEPSRKVEAEECQVEVQEVARPYTYRI